MDEPKVFMDSRRVDASLIWLSKGFVEYKLPNPLSANEQIEYIEITMEIASEFPTSNNNWPSDITFTLNNKQLGIWTCPGNFSDIRGKFTPDWWHESASQYGLLKHLRISKYDTAIDGQRISQENINTLDIERDVFTFRIAAYEHSENAGGLTLFGKGFGNWDKHIEWKFYYSERK